MSRPTGARLLGLLLLVGLLLSGSPVSAAIGPIDPQAPPPVLNADELQKVRALQSTVNPNVVSDVSPDDTTVLAVFARGSGGPVSVQFLNIVDGARRPIDVSQLASPITGEFRWLSPTTLAYLGLDQVRGPLLVTIDRTSGAVRTTPIRLPGFPLTLAPNGRRAVLVVEAGGGPEPAPSAFASPFDQRVDLTFTPRQPLAEWLRPVGFAPADDSLQAAQARLTLVSFDLATGQATPLYELPANTMPLSLAWSADSSQFALVRSHLFQSNGKLTDVTIQDTLGLLPPDQNPFLQTNVIDLVDFAGGAVRPAALRATDGNGDTFSLVDWSPDNRTLLVRMSVPSRLTGRTHPIYTIPLAERTYLRFYRPDGQALNTFDSPAIEAPLSAPAFVGPDEVIVNAASGSDMPLFYYNRATGEFHRLPLPPGSSLLDFQATRASRQLVFSFSSFTQAPEIFRIGWDGSGLTALTGNNAEVAQLNQIRVDEVRFTLANGEQHAGYLIQPAGAAFPPRDVPVVVWQEGGPSAPFLNRWATNVESPFNLLPNFGVAVLFMPLYGRYGFGVERYRALYNGNNFGQIDIDAMAEIVRQMIDQGYTSRGKVGITGCSYGGYFTNQSIVRHPDLYAAANPQCNLLDFYNEWTFGLTAVVAYIFGAPPTRAPQEYATDSPLYSADRVRAATLIFHGTRDFLPIQLAVTFHEQIQANGAAVNMYAFSNEPHGLQQAGSQLTAAQFQIAWFRQFLPAG